MKVNPKRYWAYVPKTDQFLVKRKVTKGNRGPVYYRFKIVDNPVIEPKGSKIRWRLDELDDLRPWVEPLEDLLDRPYTYISPREGNGDDHFN